MHTTGKKMNRPRFPQPGDKILVGLSQGQPYHDDPRQLSKQFEYLKQYQPSEIHPFLSDVAHYQTNIIGDLLKFTGEKEAFNTDAAAKASILNLYQQGIAWRDNQASLLSELEPTVKPVGQWLEWDADLRALLNETDTEQSIPMPNIEGVEAEKKNAYFKSICLNMKIYYLQGRLISINAQTEPHYNEIETSLKSCMQALETHNNFMAEKRFRDPFYQMAFDETSAEKKVIAQEIAQALLSDATYFLNKKKYVEGDEITANSPKWQHQLAIEYSTSYMIKNFAVVGIYTMFDDFDYYYYPRKTTNALLVFTDQCLTTIIDTLTDQSGAIAYDPLSKKQNDFIAITPFISTPVDISDVFINRLKHTIQCIHAEGYYPNNTLETYEIFKDKDLKSSSDAFSYSDAFAYWKNNENIQTLRHRSKSSNAFIQPDQDDMYNEALMNAKKIVDVALIWMRLALSKVNIPSKKDMKANTNAFQVSGHGYRKAYHAYQKIHTLFAVFFTALRADFSTDQLDGDVDKKLIDKMEVMLKSIEEEKVFYSENFQMIGDGFMASQLRDLENVYQETQSLCMMFKKINSLQADDVTPTKMGAEKITKPLLQESIFNADNKTMTKKHLKEEIEATFTK